MPISHLKNYFHLDPTLGYFYTHPAFNFFKEEFVWTVS